MGPNEPSQAYKDGHDHGHNSPDGIVDALCDGIRDALYHSVGSDEQRDDYDAGVRDGEADRDDK